MKRAIVSGANGFVGAAVAKELIDNDVEVIALGRDEHSNNIHPKATFIPFDLTQAEKLLGTELNSIGEFDAFYHFAWMGISGEARSNYKLQLQNAEWTVETMQVAQKLGCKRFVCSGSIMELESMAAAFTQEHKPGMTYVYGGGKLAAYLMCKSVAASIGIDLIWARITNTYGPGERSPRFINTTIRKIINNEPLQFTTAMQNYDFVYIDDVARAFYAIGEKGKPFCEYLIGGSNARPLKEFIFEMCETLASQQELYFGDVSFTGINLELSDFDCSKTEEDTGFRARVAFTEGIKQTFNWLKSEEA